MGALRGRANINAVFQPLRTLIGLAVVSGFLWFAFAVDLGEHTLAEHVDTISETPEAKELLEGTRGTINPAMQDVRDRVLGEYVEAPTWIPEQEEGTHASGISPMEPGTQEPDLASEPTLPGRR